MKKEKTSQIRAEFLNFLQTEERSFLFKVECAPKDRVQFIYGVIFPGFQKIKFYTNFFLARLAQYIDYSPIKVIFYRLIGMKIGKGVFISPDVILDPHFPSLITLEDYVIIGWGAKLFTHEFSGREYRIGRILIREGAVIGGFATIRGGVMVGKMAEIPYDSIVYKDVPDYMKATQMVIRHLKENA